MRPWITALLLVAMTGCSWQHRIKKLNDAEFNHFYALRPFMTEEVQKQYLKFKTEDERNQFLKDQGLWDMFYQYPEDMRTQIVAGNVQIGWTRDQVLMAWGAPYDKRKLVGRPAARSELLVYRFEVQADGTIMVYEPESRTEYQAVRRYEERLYVDDNRVTEMEQTEGWE